MCQQFWFFCCNSHDLLSLLLAHPKHPLSRRARFMLFLTTNCLQFAMATALGELFGPPAGQSRLQHAGAFVASFLASVLMAILMFVMSICITADDRLWGDLEGGRKRAATSIVGKCCVGCLFIAAVAIAGLTVLLCEMLGTQPIEQYLVVFGLSLLQSWTYIFLLTAAPKFLLRFRSQRVKAAKMNKAHAESVATAGAAKAKEPRVTSLPVEGPEASIHLASPVDTAAASDADDLLPTESSPAANPAHRHSPAPPASSTAIRVASMNASTKGTEMAVRGHAVAKSSAEWLVSVLTQSRKVGVTPAFPFSFGELQRWGRGEDIDATHAARVAAEAKASGHHDASLGEPAAAP